MKKIKFPKPKKTLIPELLRPSREQSEARPYQKLWLDKNENADPIYKEQIKKIFSDISMEALFCYPDCHTFYKKLATYLRANINELIIAAGSDGIIRAVYETFVDPGDTVIFTDPTFAMYPLYAQMAGARSIRLDYQPSPLGPVLPAEKVIQTIKKSKPKLICIPNPNSPTGTIFSPEEMRHIIHAAEIQGAVILIDEAYYPFYPQTTLAWINEYPNLIIARTFSKAWGVAGVRIGFGIGCKELIKQLHKIRPMYEAGSLSLNIAEKLLDYSSAMLSSVQRLNAGKKYFLEKMLRLGFQTVHTEANFFHVAFAKKADVIHAALADKVLYRKDFSHPSLKGYSRFTATTQELFFPIVQTIMSAIGESSMPQSEAQVSFEVRAKKIGL